MEANKKPLSIKVIYWVTNIIFWLFTVVSVLAVAVAIALMFNLFGNTQLHTGIPVAVDILEQGKLEINNTITNVKFVEMYGKLHFIDTPAFLGRIYSIFIFIILGLFFFILLTFRRFINNVYKGIYFEINNIALLKRISYTLIGVWTFTVFYAYFQYYYIVKHLEFSSVKISGDIQTYPVILLFALFIWVLSHIFMKGCKLQEENNFTI